MKYFPIFVCLLSLTTLPALAAPSLTGIDLNSLTSEIEISGDNFGAPPKVVYFDNYEAGDKFEKLLPAGTVNWLPKKLIATDFVGNDAFRARDPATVAGKEGMQQLTVKFQNIYTEAFISFSVKTPEGSTFPGASVPKTFPSMSSWKFSWLMLGENGFQSTSDFDICLPTHIGGGSFLLGGNDGTLTWIDKGQSWWDWDGFNNISSYIRFDPNSPSVNPMKYFWTITNNLINVTPTIQQQSPTVFKNSNFAFDRVNIPGWFGNGNNDKFDGVYDNVYVAVGENALARVIITDSPVFSKSRFSTVVMAKSWSNNKITLDPNTLPQSQGEVGIYYVYIADKDGVISPIPQKIICKNCPKPPTPL